MYSKKIAYLLGSILGFSLVAPMEIQATQEPIRVAFIADDGFHTMEVNGGFSGYNYDYLMKLAQYTGWTYEFVVIEDELHRSAIDVAEEMLQLGEIDLMGSMFLTEENSVNFAFGEKNYGVARHILCGLSTNNKITADTFFLEETLSVALVRGNDALNLSFERIINNIPPSGEITYVDTEEEALALLQSGEVETIMALDVSFNGSILSTLTSLTPTPFYFVTTKGNDELLSQLDQGILDVERAEYSIHSNLRSEYFGLVHQGNIILTEEEKEMLADYPYLTVGLHTGREPYQFYNGDDEAVPQGISVAILEEISTIIGVDFRYVWIDSREEAREGIANKEIDMFATMPFDSDYALPYFLDVVVTQPYLTNAVAWLHHGSSRNEANPLYYYLADNIPLYPDEELTEIFDFQTTLEQFHNYPDISIFADPYMAQYQIQNLGLTDIELQSVNSIESKICLAVSTHLDSGVVGLLNHAILHLDPFVVDEIIYNNLSSETEITFEAYVRQNTGKVLLWSVGVLTLIIIGLTYNAKKFRRLSREDSLTKLYNAGYFHDYCEKHTRKSKQGCLILLDIDFFKQVNDTYGHHAGDKVIQAVADALRRNFRVNDKVARLGGDEFVILMEGDCTVENLEERGRIILEELLNNENHVPVSLSIGGFIFDEGTSYEELYRLADSVLYKVKENGRNGYIFSDKKNNGRL